MTRKTVCSSSRKPDPLGDAFTYEYFRSLYPGHGKKMSVKAFLATKQRIPGLGNGVLQDILWDAGLDPCRILAMGIGENVTAIRYVNAKMPYYYFSMQDPDDNIIEITGPYDENRDGTI